MDKRHLGKTGLEVSLIGLGTAEIGLHELDQPAADKVLHGALDAGVTLIDTAACYGDSEERIGRAVASRRDEYVLVTKCGDEVPDVPAREWTAKAVRLDLERSLRRLGTDRVDVLLLHSCPASKLDDEGLLDALRRAKESGKAVFIGYSGDADGAAKAVTMEMFDVLETSVNLCDQQCIERYLPAAGERGLGVIAKRTLANACWRDLSQYNEFYADYARPYAQRLHAMGLTAEEVGFEGSMLELALRFAAHAPSVGCAIIGSTDPEHLRDDAALTDKGPLPPAVADRIRALWSEHDDGSWKGLT